MLKKCLNVMVISKNFARYFSLSFLVLMFVLLTMLGCKNFYPDMNVANVTVVSGKVYRTTDKAIMEELAPGDRLLKNDIIITDPDSVVEFTIDNKDIVIIKENSEVKISDLFKNNSRTDTALQIFKGTILAKPHKLSENETFHINTETITAGVRGTVFLVEYNEKILKVTVKEGKVYIRKNIKIDNITRLKEISELTVNNLDNINKKEEILSESERLIIDTEDIESMQSALNVEISDLIKEIDMLKRSNASVDEIKKLVKQRDIKILEVASENYFTIESAEENEITDGFNEVIETNDIKTVQDAASVKDRDSGDKQKIVMSSGSGESNLVENGETSVASAAGEAAENDEESDGEEGEDEEISNSFDEEDGNKDDYKGRIYMRKREADFSTEREKITIPRSRAAVDTLYFKALRNSLEIFEIEVIDSDYNSQKFKNKHFLKENDEISIKISEEKIKVRKIRIKYRSVDDNKTDNNAKVLITAT